jgi:PAS domain S-box-containing protein
VNAPPPVLPTEPPELIRAALGSSRTCVWEWRIDTDLLSDIQAGSAMLGWPPGSVGKTQDDWNQLIHPDDRAANDDAYQRHARGETDTYEHSYRARTPDGRWLWLQERGRIVERDAQGRPLRMVGTQTDITESLQMHARASAEMLRLEKLARHAPGVLFQFEMDATGMGRFPYLSEAAREILGISPDAAQHASAPLFAAIEREDRRRVIESTLASAHSLTPWRCEFRTRGAGGAPHWLLGSATPQRLPDGGTVWHGYLQDITERRELEQARQDAAMAAAANRAKTEFLSRMSHELRTPLNAVLGFTQLMEIDRAEPPGPGQQRRLGLIRGAGEHLLQMIGDLLDLTRIETGGMALQLEPVALLPLARQALDLLRASAAEAGVQLLLATGEVPLVARADPTRLRQVLLNLLSNAVKYNRPGGRVTLRLGRDTRGWMLIDVEDTGVGIASADLPHIFEPFQRGAQAHGSVDGAGIGLSVTRALVDLMQGQVQATSRPGEGSSFRVVLPPASAGHGQPEPSRS